MIIEFKKYLVHNVKNFGAKLITHSIILKEDFRR